MTDPRQPDPRQRDPRQPDPRQPDPRQPDPRAAQSPPGGYVLGAAQQAAPPAQHAPPPGQYAPPPAQYAPPPAQQAATGYGPATYAPTAYTPAGALTRSAEQGQVVETVRGGTLGRADTAALAAGTATAERIAASPDTSVGAPDGPHQGRVYSSRRPFGDVDDRAALTGRLPRLRVSSHTVSSGALSRLTLSSPGTGLILGMDVDRKTVPVRLFRTEPTRVTLVGGVWAAQLVVFRALALGARVAVMTGDPGSWQGFGERATGQSGRVAVIHGEQPMAFSAAPQQPVMVVHDLGLVGPGTAPELGPWQTQLTVLRRLDEPGVPSMQECHLVILQRLSLVEAALAASALRLSGQSTQLLQRMGDDMVALLGGGADRYVWLTQTGTEQQQIGTPRR
jgi:hypothetical protein